MFKGTRSTPLSTFPYSTSARLIKYLSHKPNSAQLQVGVNLLEGIPEYPRKEDFTRSHFKREDESDDKIFYSHPRYVTHIDDRAINALTAYYDKNLPKEAESHLDLCSSWVSFLPETYKPSRICGVGMNIDELRANKQLTDIRFQDMNKNPQLPFADGSFDVITIVVSIDYLNKPLEVSKEMRRVLRKGGSVIVSFSNRMFWTKAVDIWTAANEYQRVLIAAAYLHIGGFMKIESYLVADHGSGDPLYIVKGESPGYSKPSINSEL